MWALIIRYNGVSSCSLRGQLNSTQIRPLFKWVPTFTREPFLRGGGFTVEFFSRNKRDFFPIANREKIKRFLEGNREPRKNKEILKMQSRSAKIAYFFSGGLRPPVFLVQKTRILINREKIKRFSGGNREKNPRKNKEIEICFQPRKNKPRKIKNSTVPSPFCLCSNYVLSHRGKLHNYVWEKQCQ